MYEPKIKYDPVGENPFPVDDYSILVRGMPVAEIENPMRGDKVEKVGVHGEGRLITVAKDRSTIVVAWKGYGENPGSRYSMLYSYYPAETEVLVYHTTDEFGRHRYRTLISWQTRAPKKEGG